MRRPKAPSGRKTAQASSEGIASHILADALAPEVLCQMRTTD